MLRFTNEEYSINAQNISPVEIIDFLSRILLSVPKISVPCVGSPTPKHFALTEKKKK